MMFGSNQVVGNSTQRNIYNNSQHITTEGKGDERRVAERKGKKEKRKREGRCARTPFEGGIGSKGRHSKDR